ncbi:MAG: site-specific integrase [Bacteroidia bacterium]|nr:site-specific integrase [Bacteroidia bacterium]
MATIKPILWPRPTKEGKHIIKIRVTQDRKSRYILTDIAIAKKFWNPRERVVRASHPQASLYNASIDSYVHKAQKASYDLDQQNQAKSAVKILQKIQAPEDPSFITFAEHRLLQLERSERFRSFKRVRTVLNKLKEYIGPRKTDLLFSEITVKFLEDYAVHLQTIGNKSSTRHSDLKTISTLMNQSTKEGLIPFEKNPFHKFTIKAGKSEKTKLSDLELVAIKELELQPGTLPWHTRNYFFFSFYCGGIRVGDLMSLTWANIKEGRLSYRMDKTGKEKSVKLLPPALEILSHYHNDESKADHFLFPILKNNVDYSQREFFLKQKESKTVMINRYLKILAEKAGVDAKVTTHTARHSAADFLRRQNVNVYDISKILGHSSIKVTEAYLKTLDVDSMDSAMDSLGGI